MRNIVASRGAEACPMILETPWIGKEDKTQRPMYEAEIALLSGDEMDRFGGEFLEHVERMHFFFEKKGH